MKHALLLAAVLVMTGCAYTEQETITPDAARAITSLSVAPTVEFRGEMAYEGPGEGLGQVIAPFNYSAGLLAAAMAGDGRETFRLYLEENAISFGDIIRESMLDGVKQHPVVGPAWTEQDGEHTLHINMLVYGLTVPHRFSGEMGVILAGNARIEDAGGNVLWNSYEAATPLTGEVVTRPLEAFLGDPDLTRRDIRAAADALTRLWLQDIR